MGTGWAGLLNPQNYIFGGTAAIITNISLIVGLGSARTGRVAVLGGLLTIALADNISDSLGIHMYKESEGRGSAMSLFATAVNFLARLLISGSFILIVLVSPAAQTGLLAAGWGLLLLILLSTLIARHTHVNPLHETLKHVTVAVCVITASHYAGRLISGYF